MELLARLQEAIAGRTPSREVKLLRPDVDQGQAGAAVGGVGNRVDHTPIVMHVVVEVIPAANRTAADAQAIGELHRAEEAGVSKRLAVLEGVRHGVEEVADELGISRNTVKEHMVLAVRSIKLYFYQHADMQLALIPFVFIYPSIV